MFEIYCEKSSLKNMCPTKCNVQCSALNNTDFETKTFFTTQPRITENNALHHINCKFYFIIILTV
jgi:hypothetical protein